MLRIPVPVMRRTLPRVLSKEDIHRLIGAATCERNRVMLIVLLDTGLRIGELVDLTRENASPDGLTVNGKVGERVVPILPSVYKLLERQGDKRGFWISPHQGRLSRSGAQQAIRSCMRRAGFSLPKIGPHTLRHTFGVQYLLRGGDVVSLQAILGHTKIETTMLYAHMSNDLVSMQHRQFSPMRNLMSDTG